MRRTTGLDDGAARAARWPWAVAAVVAGAAAGAGAAYAVRRVQGEDRPDAQEPHQLRAVVDRPSEADLPA